MHKRLGGKFESLFIQICQLDNAEVGEGVTEPWNESIFEALDNLILTHECVFH